MAKLSCIVSSAKPFEADDYTNYQRRAILSWKDVTDHRILVNDPEDVESMGEIHVMPEQNPPSLRQLLTAALANTPEDGILAVVNSDIVVTSDILRALEISKNWVTWAATSFRWEDGEVRGNGLDCFLMTPRLARMMLTYVPDFMTIGRGMWDSWMNGWLRANVMESRYFDMTHWKCVHHPLHERAAGRLSNYTDDQVKQILASGHLSSRGIPNTRY